MQNGLIRPGAADDARREQYYEAMEREARHAQQERLSAFRAQHKAMGWLYRLLDVGYGIDLAVAEVDRLRSVAALKWAGAMDFGLFVLFAAIWWRYDLMSTWTVLNPLAATLYEAIPREGDFWGRFMGVAGFAVEILIRTVVTLGPSLIQFRLPHMAMNHDAAWVALWATAVFDMGTDSIDVREDTPAFFQWLIDAANRATPEVWISLIGLLLLLVFFKSDKRMLWWAGIGVCAACLFFGQAGNFVYWGNVGFWTFFASFASQSLAIVQGAKCLYIAKQLRYAQAAARARA